MNKDKELKIIMIILSVGLLFTYIYIASDENRGCGWNPIKVIYARFNECWCEEINGSTTQLGYLGFGCWDCEKKCQEEFGIPKQRFR